MFPGTLRPGPEEFGFLRNQGIEIVNPADKPGGRGDPWMLALLHPRWGGALLTWSPKTPPPPTELVGCDVRWVSPNVDRLRSAKVALLLSLVEPGDHVLTARKRLLCFAGAVLGSDGLAAYDIQSSGFWPPEDLAEESAHDADVDVSALYSLHLVQCGTPEEPLLWLHTHGLRELGFLDVDVLSRYTEIDRDPNVLDMVRSVAFSVVEGRARAGGACQIMRTAGGSVRLVPMAEFRRRASPDLGRWMEALDEEHIEGRAVLCAMSRWPRWLPGGPGPRPTSLFDHWPEDQPLNFSDEATELMAQRARATVGLLQDLRREAAEFGFRAIAKLGYEPSGRPELREHLWFEVHDCDARTLDATLASEPWGDLGMKSGDRRRHDLERLTDWGIITPFGMINPRSMWPARSMRLHADELREAMKRRAAAARGVEEPGSSAPSPQ